MGLWRGNVAALSRTVNVATEFLGRGRPLGNYSARPGLRNWTFEEALSSAFGSRIFCCLYLLAEPTHVVERSAFLSCA